MHPADSPHVATQLRNIIYYALDNDILQTALFHAGRLHGLDSRNGDAAHLIALCHFRMGQYKAAYDYSRERGLRGVHLGCSYVFAQSCLALSKPMEGATALERAKGFWATRNHWNKHTESMRRHVPDAAAVNFLLGKLWSSYGEVSKAVDSFLEALRLNPFMWEAFTDLCQTGVKLKAQNIFKMTSEMLATLDPQNSNLPSTDNVAQNLPLQPHINGNLNGMITPGNDPFNPKPRLVSSVYSDANVVQDAGNGLEWETPTTNASKEENDVMMDDAQFVSEAPPAPARRNRNQQGLQPDLATDIPKMGLITTRGKIRVGPDHGEYTEHSIRPTSIPVSHKRTISGQMSSVPAVAISDVPGAPQRRSDRLLRSRLLPGGNRLAAAVSRDPESRERRELRKAKATGTKGKTASTVGRVVSGNRKPLEPTERDTKDGRPASVASNASTIRETSRKTLPSALDLSPQKDALLFLLDQYCKIGQGYIALNRFDCPAALTIFDSLLPQLRETPWVLAQVGRAHFEKSAYLEAEQSFSKIRKIAPSRTEDMEVYSTVLWHLKKDVHLSYLSHELIEMDRLSPQAWCALGNAFSLQGEHDQAVKCFKRATQLDPKFAYAFTLAGHEHVANEEFEKALFAFRSAITADQRHYNGWYGLGRVFEKLGKYEIARDHYINAAKINSTNPVLKVCIGLVLEKTCVGIFPEKQRRRELALEMYHEACEQDPRSAKARFAKARLLLILHRPKEAFYELDILKNMMPDDADVHFLLGRVYKALRDTSSALRHFTIAMNLDPKATNLIKESLETLEDSDDDYDDDEID